MCANCATKKKVVFVCLPLCILFFVFFFFFSIAVCLCMQFLMIFSVLFPFLSLHGYIKFTTTKKFLSFSCRLLFFRRRRCCKLAYTKFNDRRRRWWRRRLYNPIILIVHVLRINTKIETVCRHTCMYMRLTVCTTFKQKKS